MVIGILQVELTIDGARSIKDKRRVVTGLKDRLHRRHQVSVAEVDHHDDHHLAVLGITLASTSVPHCQSVLDRLVERIRLGRGYALADHSLEILSGQ